MPCASCNNRCGLLPLGFVPKGSFVCKGRGRGGGGGVWWARGLRPLATKRQWARVGPQAPPGPIVARFARPPPPPPRNADGPLGPCAAGQGTGVGGLPVGVGGASAAREGGGGRAKRAQRGGGRPNGRPPPLWFCRPGAKGPGPAKRRRPPHAAGFPAAVPGSCALHGCGKYEHLSKNNKSILYFDKNDGIMVSGGG